MYISHGHEPRAFQVAHPNDLYEPHRSLICDHLNNETPLVTVYCPVWEGGNGIWGHQNPGASSALSLTEGHWFITLHDHEQNSTRFFRIAHRDVVAVEIGQALLLGWLRIHFSDADRVRQTDLLFNAHVILHFRKVLNLWRYFYSGNHQSNKAAAFEIANENDFPLLKEEAILWRHTLPAVIRKNRRKVRVLAHRTDLFLTATGFLLFRVQESAADKDQLTFAEAYHAWPVRKGPLEFRIGQEDNRILFELHDRGKDHVRFDFFKEQFDEQELKKLKVRVNAIRKTEDVELYSKSD